MPRLCAAEVLAVSQTLMTIALIIALRLTGAAVRAYCDARIL